MANYTSFERFLSYPFQKFTYDGGYPKNITKSLELYRSTHNCFYVPCYYKGYHRPSEDEISHAVYIALDIDYKLSVYNNRSCTMENYTDEVLGFLTEYRMPPTLAISTGNGIHALYELNNFEWCKTKQVSGVYRDIAQKSDLINIGLDIQACWMGSTFRLPKTFNHKSTKPKEVNVIYEDENIYDINDLFNAINEFDDVISVKNESIESVGRNNYCYKLGIKLLSQGYPFNEVEEELYSFQRLNVYNGTHPFTLSEVRGIVKSLSRAKIKKHSNSVYIKNALLDLQSYVPSLRLVSRKDTNNNLVYVLGGIIQHFAMKTGTVLPISQNKLSELLGVSQPTVSRSIKKLIELGILSIIDETWVVSQKCKVYSINLGNINAYINKKSG